MTEIHPIQLHAQPYEVKLYLNGGSYHLIFGRQINGWFLCIPNHQIGVELAHPSNQLWNQGSLEEAGMAANEASVIACALKELSQFI